MMERAMEAERLYVERKLRGEQPVPLADMLAEHGYTLDGYFEAKREHAVAHMAFEVVESTPWMGSLVTADFAMDGAPAIVFGDTDGTYVFHGDEPYDDRYCRAHGIPVVEYGASGGTIVITDGDLSLGLSVPCADVTAEYLLGRLAGILSAHVGGIAVEGNDIMQDGRKVAGSASFEGGAGIGLVVHFSLSDKTELIEAICPAGGKPVGHLAGITGEQIRQGVLSWLRRP